jgi:tetratricopeptide (TPR) repeat protein
MKCNSVFLTAVLLGGNLLRAGQPVRAWEETLVLPTYAIGAPDPSPLFDVGRVYQRAHAPVYPYFMLDSIGDRKTERTYHAVYLENRYVKICILPELGGRLFSATDKTNGYDYVYRQNVIKPALVGMMGAWISGGIEWDTPHHHRATTFMPVSHRIEQHPDGSRTVWVGELELRDRMKWLVGMTLRPDSSALEITGKMINRTPLANSFLYFANIAVQANPQYQVIFPPATEYATNHHKKEFSRWPVSDNIYNNIDFRQGVDVSMWKNHPSPISMFAWGGKGEFVAGYDHGKQAGIVHIGSRHNAAGMKFFTWGAGKEGQMWDDLLTDGGGPYIELMAGAYSDNQPDYTWIQPYETKTFREFLYPLRRIEGVKAANDRAALNMEVDTASRSVKIAVIATSEHRDANVELRAKGVELFRETAAIAPDRVFSRIVPLPAGLEENDLTVTVSSRGQELIRYHPVPRENATWPVAVVPPAPPARIPTVEEVYLSGQRIEQFRTAGVDPEAYYLEALRRDPGDVRTNTAMGLRQFRRGLYADAVRYLEKALQRSVYNHTTPKDGETYYYLGLARRGLRQPESARDAFNRAAWSAAWQAAACLQLAELEAQAGNAEPALAFLQRSLDSNPQNTEALDLRAALSRHTGDRDGAESALRAALAIDPLDRWAEYQELSSTGDSAALDELRLEASRDLNPYLEAALGYLRAGLPQEAHRALSDLAPRGPSNPLWRYYLGYTALLLGKSDEAAAQLDAAAKSPSAYCAPFRLEDIEVLESVAARNPADSLAHYLLGNALFDLQPARAIRAWERSRDLNASFAPVHRNLALAYSRVQSDHVKAIAAMRSAIERNPREPRFLLELDQLQEAAHVDVGDRLKVFEQHSQVAAMRDDTLTRMIDLMVKTGDYTRAIEALCTRFNTWEGAGKTGVHEVYVDAYLGRGDARFAARHFREAIDDYTAALAYPVNLGTPQPMRGARYPEIYFKIGLAHEALAENEKAKAAFELAVSKGPVRIAAPRPAAIEQPQVFQALALALRKLGRASEANSLLQQLMQAGRDQIEDKVQIDFFTPYGEPDPLETRLAQAHFAIGLAHDGLGENQAAKSELEEAVRIKPDLVRARQWLAGRNAGALP